MGSDYNSEKYKKWYAEHREEQKQRKLKYYYKNKEQINSIRNKKLREKYKSDPLYREQISKKGKRYRSKPGFKEQQSIRSRRYYSKILHEQLKKLGNKCERCGYNKILEILQFHHRIPVKRKSRDYPHLTRAEYLKRNKQDDMTLEKYALLCPTCHMEVHYEMQQDGLEAKGLNIY